MGCEQLLSTLWVVDRQMRQNFWVQDACITSKDLRPRGPRLLLTNVLVASLPWYTKVKMYSNWLKQVPKMTWDIQSWCFIWSQSSSSNMNFIFKFFFLRQWDKQILAKAAELRSTEIKHYNWILKVTWPALISPSALFQRIEFNLKFVYVVGSSSNHEK